MLYITDQYYRYNHEESSADRQRHIRDTRVSVVLYFIAPTGHGLKPLDVEAMKAISKVANLIPVIAKADALTIEERAVFKKRVRAFLVGEYERLIAAGAAVDLRRAQGARHSGIPEQCRRRVRRPGAGRQQQADGAIFHACDWLSSNLKICRVIFLLPSAVRKSRLL